MPCLSFVIPGIGWRLEGWKPARPAVRMTKVQISGSGGARGTRTAGLRQHGAHRNAQ